MVNDGQPRFVVLEGLDGAGTTTQSQLLTEALQARDLRVYRTAEPSDGPLGRIARAHVRREVLLDPATAALAFTADRADHLAREIRPALARGEWVVCDRYLLSTVAYQGAEGVDARWIVDISASFEIPDLTVVLDVPAHELAARLSSRDAEDRYEHEALREPLAAAHATAAELLRALGHRVEFVDGTAPPADVTARILTLLDEL